jgi:hypothetical protein
MVMPEQRLLQTVITSAIANVSAYQKKGVIKGFTKSQQRLEYMHSLLAVKEIDEYILEIAGFEASATIMTHVRKLLAGKEDLKTRGDLITADNRHKGFLLKEALCE